MTTPETPPTAPERPASPLEGILTRIVAAAPTRRAVRQIEQLVNQHGTPAVYYLNLSGVDPYSPTLEEDYENVFVGIYDKPEHLITDTIEAMGWAEPVRNLIHEWAIPPGVLTFDHDLVWDHLYDMYTLIHDHGELHVFHR